MEKNLLDVLKNRIDTKVGTITALDFAVKAFKSANSESKAPFFFRWQSVDHHYKFCKYLLRTD